MSEYTAYYNNGDAYPVSCESDYDTATITSFYDGVHARPDWAIMEDEWGDLHPAMSWRDYKDRGALSGEFGSLDDFDEWLVAVDRAYAGCFPPTYVFKETGAPYPL